MHFVINLEEILGKVERPRKKLVGMVWRNDAVTWRALVKDFWATELSSWRLGSFSITWNLKGKALQPHSVAKIIKPVWAASPLCSNKTSPERWDREIVSLLALEFRRQVTRFTQGLAVAMVIVDTCSAPTSCPALWRVLSWSYNHCSIAKKIALQSQHSKASQLLPGPSSLSWARITAQLPRHQSRAWVRAESALGCILQGPGQLWELSASSTGRVFFTFHRQLIQELIWPFQGSVLMLLEPYALVQSRYSGCVNHQGPSKFTKVSIS